MILLDSGSIFGVRNRLLLPRVRRRVSQLCGKALVGQTWHVHHCVNEKDDLHGQSHSCPCGHEWTNEEQLTLAPYLKIYAEAG